MDFAHLIATRQSVRRYEDKPVEEEKLSLLIEAVRLAPSASNSQPWKLIIVNNPDLKNKVAQATFSTLISFNKFAPQAPVLAVLVIEKPKMITQIGGMLKEREFSLIDIGIAAEHFCLQAADLGLGTCMLGWFDEAAIKQLLRIPKEKRIGLVITLGYAKTDDPLRKKIRKSTWGLLLISLAINLGMWFERFNIVVTSLANDFLPSNWASYSPTLIEVGVYVGTIGLFVVGVLLFFRYIPMIAISEVKGVLNIGSKVDD